jgi:hypothetical protein
VLYAGLEKLISSGQMRSSLMPILREIPIFFECISYDFKVSCVGIIGHAALYCTMNVITP